MLGVPKDCLREARTLRASDRGKSTRRRHVPSLIEKEVVTSRCHGHKTKKTKQMTCIQSSLCMIAFRSKTVAHTTWARNYIYQHLSQPKINLDSINFNIYSEINFL